MLDKRFLFVLLIAVLLLGLIIGTALKFGGRNKLWTVKGEVGGVRIKEGRIETLTDSLAGLGLVNEGRDMYLSVEGPVVVDIVFGELGGVPGYESVVTLNEGRFVMIRSRSYFEDKKKLVIIVEPGEALIDEPDGIYEKLGETQELAISKRLVDNVLFHLLWNTEWMRRQSWEEVGEIKANLLDKLVSKGDNELERPIYLEMKAKR